MMGTIVNVAGISVGALLGLTAPRLLSPARESFFKVPLGAVTVFYGLRLTWISLNGSVAQVLKQLLMAVLALMLGKLAGRLLRLQKLSNRLGQEWRQRLSTSRPDEARRPSEGFKTCAALFCAAPLGIVGAVQDGVSHYY